MKFYKTTWFKCVACLLLISVISGALLASFNDLWYVSLETRTARAITKIYGEEMAYEDKTVEIEYDGVGKINKIYEIHNGDVLFQTTGYLGYKNGTITLWIKTVQKDGKYSIEKVLLETFEKQTLMGKLTGDFYNGFNLTDITEAYNNNTVFRPKAIENETHNPIYNPVSGATYSATAACNAVNCVIRYFGGER